MHRQVVHDKGHPKYTRHIDILHGVENGFRRCCSRSSSPFVESRLELSSASLRMNHSHEKCALRATTSWVPMKATCAWQWHPRPRQGLLSKAAVKGTTKTSYIVKTFLCSQHGHPSFQHHADARIAVLYEVQRRLEKAKPPLASTQSL